MVRPLPAAPAARRRATVLVAVALAVLALVAPTAAVADDPPTVSLTSPARDAAVSGPTVRLAGTASDDLGIAEVGVAVRELSTGRWLRPDGSYGAFVRHPATLERTGPGTTGWTLEVALATGEHGVSLLALDTAGAASPTPWSRFVVEQGPDDPPPPDDGPDTTPPTVAVTAPSPGAALAGSPVTMAGRATDARGVTRVTVAVRDRDTGAWLRPDGSWGGFARLPATSAVGTDVAWSFGADLGTGRYGFVADAFDAAGNRSTESPWTIFTVTAAPPPPPPPPPPPSGTATLLAAGDVANCRGQEAATGALVASLEGTVAVLGDLAYPDGSAATFADCYDPAWGSFRDRTRPAIGNHDVQTAGGAPYHDYFGAAAGPRGLGWYSYELGAWHVVVLNTNCDLVGGCGSSSPQVAWLRDDLADAGPNVVAVMHHPRFSTGSHGDNPWVSTLWQVLDDAGADLLLSGHDHSYQRFAPMHADGTRAADGMVQFVVGTGGTNLTGFPNDRPNVAARQQGVHGVLQLTLEACGYGFRFLGIDGSTRDSGSVDGTC